MGTGNCSTSVKHTEMAFDTQIPLKRLPKWHFWNIPCNFISFHNVGTGAVRYLIDLILFSARIFPAPKLRVKSTKDDKIEFVTDAGQVSDCYFIQHCFICPPLSFRCVGGCWDRTQDRCDFGIGSQTLLTTRRDLFHIPGFNLQNLTVD